MSRPVTAAQAIDCLELMQIPAVKLGTIRQWANRGTVRKYGLDQQGRQRYELADIVQQARI